MGILKWYVAYRLLTRGRRRRKAEDREKANLPTLWDSGEYDESFDEYCEDCYELIGDHLMGDEEILCP